MRGGTAAGRAPPSLKSAPPPRGRMELPRGMRDVYGEEIDGIEEVRSRFYETASLFGFGRIDPSPIESLETLEAKSGAAILDEVYHFEDKGGRRVALRFDFTVGLARHVASSRSMALPARLASFGGVFRYDEPQRGRYRYFHQWNAEIFGRPTVEAEAEIVEFTSRLLASLGLGGARIRIGHRGVSESFVRSSLQDAGAAPGPGASGGIVADALRLVDKSSKRPREQLLGEYAHLPRGFAEGLLDFAAARGTLGEVEEAVGGTGRSASSLEGWDGLAALWDALGARSVPNVEVALGIVRGLDYYSGSVFEAFAGEEEEGGGDPAGGALAGGGRYDALMGAFGRPEIGAAGVAGGVERTLLAMSAARGGLEGEEKKARGTVRVVYAGGGGGEAQREAMRIAAALRRAGVPAWSDLAGRPLKKQLGAAAASGAELAVIVGPSEIERRVVAVRRMGDRAESEAGLDDLLADPRRALGSALGSAQEKP